MASVILVTSQQKNDDYESINSVNPLYLIIGKANGYIEESNGTRHSFFTSTDGNKKILAKFLRPWVEIYTKLTQ